MSAHALLGASSAKKWLNCTKSARLEETIEETKSDYADEGTLAHEFGQLKLQKAFKEPMSTRAYNSAIKKLQENALFKPDMMSATDVYLDYVNKVVHSYSCVPYVAIEKRINYSHIAPEGFGTGDCIVIGGDTLHVIDYKHGMGVSVSAYENPQMMLYAIGAVNEYNMLFDIKTVKMAIVQPRIDNISEYELTIEELLAWGESIKATAEQAFNGLGEFKQGDWCDSGFCKARATCRARAQANTALEDFGHVLPPLLSNTEVGEILLRAQNLAAWVAKLEDFALSEILKGNEITGWKAVNGRATRKFTDIDAAFNVLKEQGVEEAMLYERKPLTLTGVEGLIGKPLFKQLLSDYVNTPPGKPALAVLSDSRDPITRVSAEDDFSEKGDQANE